MRIRKPTAVSPARRVWWQFRVTTLLIASPILTLLIVVALSSSPYWWKARSHDVAVQMFSHNAASNREWALARPDEAATYLRFATQADARVVYHESLSQKYWSLTVRPWAWLFVTPDPPPPP